MSKIDPTIEMAIFGIIVVYPYILLYRKIKKIIFGERCKKCNLKNIERNDKFIICSNCGAVKELNK